MHEAEQFFERFQRTGDAGALARVFDLTAPKLLLVGLRFSGNAADAEDLVQSTFVRAIRGVRRFRTGAALMPWLIGILAHEAQMLRRKTRRRTGAHVDALWQEPDPAELAAAAELDSEIATALDALPEAQRQVLLLRLRHGLDSVAIGQALGRSPETVRSQWKRGLERLRRLLPESYSLPAVLLPDCGRGLTAVRDAVLAQTGTKVTSGAVLVLAGAMVMKKLVVSGVVSAALAACLLVWRPWSLAGAASAPAGEIGTAGVAAATAPNAAPGLPAAPAPTPTSRSDDPLRRVAVAAEHGTPTEPLVRLFGRCVDEARLALAGCAVELGPRGGKGGAERTKFSLTTGADGRFEFWLTPAETGVLTLRATADQRVTREANDWPRSEEFAREGQFDLGDITMFAGAEICGRVLDEQDQPVPGVLLSLASAPPPLFDWVEAETARSARCSSDWQGTFKSKVLRCGTWNLRLSARGIWLAEPATITVGASLEPIVVRVHRVPPIAGVVVDERGAPIGGLTVEGCADPEIRVGRPTMSVKSAADGSFALQSDGTQGAEDSVRIAVRAAPDLGHVQAAEPPRVRFGTKDLRIVMRKLGVLRLRVVQDRSGQPIERFAVDVNSEPVQNVSLFGQKPHPKGELLERCLPQGPAFVRVLPGDKQWCASDWISVAPAAESEPLTVRLAPAPRTQVRVVDSEGSPIAKERVWLYDACGGEIGSSARMITNDALIPRTQRFPLRMDFAQTDAAGIAILHEPWRADGRFVGVQGQGHATVFVRLRESRSGEPFEVRIAAGGELRGRIASLDVLRLRPEIVLFRDAAAHEESFPGQWESIPVSPAGAFHAENVPAGAWHVFLSLGTLPVPPALGVVTIGDRQTAEVVFDASGLVPSGLDSAVTLAGKPVARGSLRFFRRGLALRMEATEVVQGHACTTLLLPGDYVIELHDTAADAAPRLGSFLGGGDPPAPLQRDHDRISVLARASLSLTLHPGELSRAPLRF